MEEGTQPIHVLNKLIKSKFENEKERLLNLLTIGKISGIEYISDEIPEVIFKCEEVKVVTPAEIMPNNKIILYETFLSFLWCTCFSTIVNYNEVIHKPRINKEVDQQLIDQGDKVYNYGMSLLNRFSDWDPSIPNPKNYSEELSHMIKVTNEAYLNAVWLIILHEFAHALYGHYSELFSGREKSIDKLVMEEIQADQFAYRYCRLELDNTPEIYREDKLSGFILGLLALMMSKKSLYTTGYPEIHKRAIVGLRLLSWSPLNIAWGICASIFQKWAIAYGYSHLKIGTKYESSKHYCLHLGSVIQTTVVKDNVPEIIS